MLLVVSCFPLLLGNLSCKIRTRSSIGSKIGQAELSKQFKLYVKYKILYFYFDGGSCSIKLLLVRAFNYTTYKKKSWLHDEKRANYEVR